MDSPPPTSPADPPAADAPSAVAGEINPLKLQDFVRRRRDAQNLGLAMLGGVIGAAAGALLWGGITAATKYQIGFMAIGIGFLTGFGVRYLGKGMDPIFGFVGAALSLAGCLAGNLLATIFMVSAQEHIPLGTIAARMSPDLAWTMLVDTFSPMDLLFYGLAVYFGYKYSFHPITHAELETLRS
jgi:hypothetical protein